MQYIERRTIDIELDTRTIAERLSRWSPPAVKYETGVFAKYVALVGSAAEGAVTFRPSSLAARG